MGSDRTRADRTERIVSARIVTRPDPAEPNRLVVTTEAGVEKALFVFDPAEKYVTADEFCGITIAEAMTIFWKRGVPTVRARLGLDEQGEVASGHSINGPLRALDRVSPRDPRGH